MARYDCVVLYNSTIFNGSTDSVEKLYPANLIRHEVAAVEESLRGGGYNPYVMSVDYFTRDLVQTLAKISPRFVFNLCEEINGDPELEMCVAGLLEIMYIPYTGSGPLALGLALNKFRVKQLLRAAGIPSPRGFLHSPGRKLLLRNVRFPVIVKPVHEDASLGINEDSVCFDAEGVERQAAYVHDAYGQEALVEEYLDGREFNISLMGNGEVRVLAVSEIDFSGLPEGHPRIVSYRAKWDEESEMFRGTVPVCPARLPKRLENRIREIALRSYRCIGCRDYARVDMRTDKRGCIHVLEVNPNPDLSPQAGFARAAEAAGFSYAEVVLEISRLAIQRAARAASPAYALAAASS
jgi:D-alanine-D-alanine ligase